VRSTTVSRRREGDTPFIVIDHQQGNPARMQDGTWQHRVVEHPIFDTNILHINADVLPHAITQLPPGLLEGRRNIGYWTWELPEFPAKWRGAFELVDEIWVPSRFVFEAIGADAPIPVHVIPHAVRAPEGPFLERASFDLPPEAYQFLVMYDTQSVQRRKNPQGPVEAFGQAFEASDASVSLVVKVNSSGPNELDELRRFAADRSNVHLITTVLSRHGIDSLMACSDAFVSLHRSEGFGLPMPEAMALGRPVIATGWSGNMDFMSDETAAVVDYRLVTLERSYGPYEIGQRWAEPDVDDAARHMRHLRDDPASGKRMGARAASAIVGSNDPVIVGRAMVARLAATA
jgi:glycosyltransferase involved in cell wall biosynthesis